MKKLSIIRGDTVAKCPYGLPIIEACDSVGDTVLTMQIIDNVNENDIENTIKRNKIIYFTQKIGERCPFANSIMKKFNTVDCSWGDTAAGEGVHYLTPSPLYPRTFIGDGLEPGSSNKGQGIYDPRQYFDAPERGINVPYGLFSIFSNRSNELGIIRIAEKYTNKSSTIRDKLVLLRNTYFDTLKSIISNSSVVKLNDEQLEKLLFIIDDWTK
jgi:hypothetical protein